jgi:hypothetical protein
MGPKSGKYAGKTDEREATSRRKRWNDDPTAALRMMFVGSVRRETETAASAARTASSAGVGAGWGTFLKLGVGGVGHEVRIKSPPSDGSSTGSRKRLACR